MWANVFAMFCIRKDPYWVNFAICTINEGNEFSNNIKMTPDNVIDNK